MALNYLSRRLPALHSEAEEGPVGQRPNAPTRPAVRHACGTLWYVSYAFKVSHPSASSPTGMLSARNRISPVEHWTLDSTPLRSHKGSHPPCYSTAASTSWDTWNTLKPLPRKQISKAPAAVLPGFLSSVLW